MQSNPMLHLPCSGVLFLQRLAVPARPSHSKLVRMDLPGGEHGRREVVLMQGPGIPAGAAGGGRDEPAVPVVAAVAGAPAVAHSSVGAAAGSAEQVGAPTEDAGGSGGGMLHAIKSHIPGTQEHIDRAAEKHTPLGSSAGSLAPSGRSGASAAAPGDGTMPGAGGAAGPALAGMVGTGSAGERSGTRHRVKELIPGTHAHQARKISEGRI